MRTNVIREKLYDYIRFAEEKKSKLYTMVEEEIAAKNNPWDDAQFIAELDRRVEEYERGEATASTWEEVKAKAVALNK